MSSIIVKYSEKHKKEVDKIVRRRMLYAAGSGLVPFPLIDVAAILSIHGIPFRPHIAKTLICSLIEGLGTFGVIKLIPGLGSVLGGATVSASAAASTYAIGKIFALHFDQGGTLLDFDPISTRKYFEELFREGQLKTEEIQKNRKNKVEKVVDFISPSKVDNTRRDSIKEETDGSVLAPSLKRREAVLERRRKMVRKDKLKSFLKKLGKYIGLILITILVFNLIYVANKDVYKEPDTELDLYMKENAAKKMKLEPIEEPDLVIDNTIAEFAPNSTEYVIAKYIESPESTYPKRYALSAARFINNSVSLSSGGEEQLINIALLMKKYPDMTVNLYGHSSSIGPKFSRQKIGRERARVLKSIFLDGGIPGFRLTGNYIEKADAVHDEYWGAEIVIDILTKESDVVVEPPELIKPVGKIQNALGWAKTKVFREPGPEPEPENITKPPKKNRATPASDKPIAHTPDKTKVLNILATEIDTGTILETPDSNATEDVVEQTRPEPDSSANETDSDPEIDSLDTSEPETEEKEEETVKKKLFSKGTAEAVISSYVELPNASFPKAFALSNTRFEGTSKDLNATAKEQSKNLAALLDLYPNIKVNIYALIPGSSSTEMTADELYDFQSKWKGIGEKRAQNVKNVLKEMGISSRRIKVRTRRLNRTPEDNDSWGMEIEVENK